MNRAKRLHEEFYGSGALPEKGGAFCMERYRWKMVGFFRVACVGYVCLRTASTASSDLCAKAFRRILLAVAGNYFYRCNQFFYFRKRMNVIEYKQSGNRVK